VTEAYAGDNGVACCLRLQHYSESNAALVEFVADPAAVNYSNKHSSITIAAAAADAE